MARKKKQFIATTSIETKLEEAKQVKRQVIEKTAALATAGFGLVAALAWNTAIQEAFRRWFGTQQTLGAMLAYAIVVTAVAVVVTLWIGKIAGEQ